MVTLDRRRRHVLLMEMISEDLLLFMLEGDFSKRYWSMMDRRGYIRQIPKGLEEILEL